MNESIPLSQKLYLLGINPDKGGIISASYTAMDYIILGSLFLEMYQNQNIRFDKKNVEVLNTKTKNDLHRFLLEKMSKSAKPLKIARWINKFYFSLKYIRKTVRQGLVDKRIVKMENKQFLFFKWQKPVLVNKQVVFSLTNEIENKVFGSSVTEDDVMLLSFLIPGGLMRRLFPDRDKRKRAKTNLDRMLVDNQVSIAVADAVSAAQAVAASVATTTAVTAATS